jgi:hypothetical protein
MSAFTDSIYKLYPQVVRTVGDVAYDSNGNEVQYDSASVQNQVLLDQCKSQAKDLLSATDWSVLPDVQIQNKADFENYRAICRGYVLSPVTNPTFPTEPQPVWG